MSQTEGGGMHIRSIIRAHTCGHSAVIPEGGSPHRARAWGILRARAWEILREDVRKKLARPEAEQTEDIRGAYFDENDDLRLPAVKLCPMCEAAEREILEGALREERREWFAKNGMDQPTDSPKKETK